MTRAFVQRNVVCHSRQFIRQSSTSYSAAGLLASPPSESQDVTIAGFVRSIRNQKTRSFLSIGDGSSLEPLQALLSPAQAQNLTTGSAVCLRGQWKASPSSKVQSHELHVKDVSLLGTSDPTSFPLQKKYHTPEYLRTIPHLRTRTPFNSLMLRFRSRAIAQITNFFAEQEFIQTHPPILTSSDCEGAGEVFNISTMTAGGKADPSTFFRSPKYLTVSSQLHLEALAQSVGKVWTLSPTFRAERSDTNRHLSEFYMLEAELNFASDMHMVMDVVEDMLRDLTRSLYHTKLGKELISGRRTGESGVEQASDETSHLDDRWQGMMAEGWPRLTYSEAIDRLQKSGETFEHKPIWGLGLQAEHERYIAQSVGSGKPVFVTRYPKKIKPFYMLPVAKDVADETVECFDLLVPEVCEIVGGSMREHRLPQLIEAMQEQGMVPTNADIKSDDAFGSLKWYVDLRKWGSVPHGGFGLGFDRLLGYLSGVQNIREVVAFPRWVGRCDC